MKTFRLIGMAVMAVLMCVNFASCSNDDEEDKNVYYAYGIHFGDLISDDSFETELKINESEELICFTSNYVEGERYTGRALVTNFHLFTEDIYFQILNENNSYYHWTEEKITKENLYSLELPAEVYYLGQSLEDYKYIAYYSDDNSSKISSIFVYNKEF